MGTSEPLAALDELGALLRRLRAERRLSMVKLERLSGLGHTTVSQALNGRKVPSEETLTLLAKVLRGDVDALLSLRARAAAALGPSDEDGAFEKRYRDYVIDRHSRLTVVGLDLDRPDGACWPLDAAYLSLELAAQRGHSDVEWLKDHGPSLTVERAEQALSGQRRTMVRGLAGSGKTTLLQWLAVTAARQSPPEELAHLGDLIPFVLPLRTLDRKSQLPDPARFLETTGSMLAAAQPPGWADRVLRAGRGLVLVDGIDEVPKQRREHTREWLRELLAAYPDTHYAVTTRPSAVPERWLEGLDFTELTVRPMNRRDVMVFISRWHAAAGAPPELRESLKDAVRGQRDLAQLATTPLMCALMCALHRDRRGHLPHGRLELYEAALSMLLVRRDYERDIGAPEGIRLNRHQAVQLLQRLAYWLIRNGQAEMEEDTALAVVEEALPSMPAVSQQGDAAQVLGHLVSRCGLLRRPTADTIDFVHRTFQDYLGAKAAVEARDLGLLVRHAHDDQWEDVLRMAVAHARPAERATLLRRLVARGDKAAKHRTRLHLLAMACLEQATELDPQVREAVESRVAGVLPPRSYEEAKRLASVGPVILDLLPGPDGLEKDEAMAVVQTAVRVGGDAALTLLKRYRDCSDLAVESALVGGWEAFDAQEYAEEILRHLPGKSTITVSRGTELRELLNLPHKSSMSFTGAISPEEIVSVADLDRLLSLGISGNPLLSDFTFLGNLPKVRKLTLVNNRIQDISSLAGLRLTDLVLWDSHLPDMTPLADLSDLAHLNLDTHLPYSDLASLPAPSHLRELYLWRAACRSTALDGISRFTWLEYLSLVAPEISETAWSELTSVPRLTGMQIVGQDVALLARRPPLPQVVDLTLNDPVNHRELAPVTEAFPHLRSLRILCPVNSGDTVDLTALSGARTVQTILIANAKEVIGLDLFPPEAVTLRPRPRR
ncbi:hypothetical protein VR41_04535 [Streptomyces sp. NRRL B-1568]|nr:hypothetical protein VR41_04535 [Streptomyces sp. NRRL B-1568]